MSAVLYTTVPYAHPQIQSGVPMNASQVKSRIAYDKIRKLILTGKKKPGARLVLAELERELDMGRGPVREALMRLDSSGLVHNIPLQRAGCGAAAHAEGNGSPF